MPSPNLPSPRAMDASGGPARSPPPARGERLLALDAYRGLIMATLAFSGFGLSATAGRRLDDLRARDVAAVAEGSPAPAAWSPAVAFWSTVKSQFDHREWRGCSFWDLVQPSFMFMVGASAAFSYRRRAAGGASRWDLLMFALRRGVVLVLISVFLASAHEPATEWEFFNVLAQIGLGYPALALAWGRTPRVQLAVAAVILGATWCAYVAYPHAGIDAGAGDPSRGVPASWAHDYLAGVPAAWHKNANWGAAVDRRLLNVFPRPRPFEFNRGGYATINFIPSIATMIFGLLAGEFVQGAASKRRRAGQLAAAGVAALGLGALLAATGHCPLVKRLWTPSFAIFSTGWCLLCFAALYWACDVRGWRRWAYPLVVIGANPLAIYCIHMLMTPWIAAALRRHLGPNVFRLELQFGATTLPLAGRSDALASYAPLVEAMMTGLVIWLIGWWMYRRQIFIRL